MTISIDILIMAICVLIATFGTFGICNKMLKLDWTAVTKLTAASFGTSVFMLVSYAVMAWTLDAILGIWW